MAHSFYHTPAIKPFETLRSVEYARVVDAVCEGEIEGLANGDKSIYLDGTPLQNADTVEGTVVTAGSYNFENVTVVSALGTADQEHLEGFHAVESENSVGVEILKNTPVTRTLSNSNLTHARLAVNIPRLVHQDLDSGDLNGTTVQYKVSLESADDPGVYTPQYVGGIALNDLTPVSGVATTAIDATGFNGTVAWTHNLDNPGDNDYAKETIVVDIEYKLDSSGTWLTHATLELIEDADGTTTTNRGAFNLTGLPAASYNIRVTKVSGEGVEGYSSDGGTATLGYIREWIPSTTITIRGKATSVYTRNHLVNLSQTGLDTAPWNIRITRLTDDSTAENLQNETWWNLYTEIIDNRFRYPHTALMGVELDSTQFSSLPTRAYDLKLLKIKIPSNYNPITRKYSGIWDGTFTTAWSDNPAWCFYDLVTNTRYGLGYFIDSSLVDKATLYTIGQYCDETVTGGLGSSEPRFTCNLYIQTREEAYKVLTNMASIFRGMLYWSNNLLTVIQDSPEDIYAQFTNADIIDGMFNYEGSAARVRHTVVLVTWNDPDNEYKQTIEYVEDSAAVALNGVNETEVIAVGCTSRAQAHRVGRWILFTEQNETEVVSFKTGLEGSQVAPGKIIRTSDQHRAGVRHGGRITAATDSTVTLDSDLIVGSGDTITNVLPEGGLHDATFVTPGTYTAGTAISITPAFSVSPVDLPEPIYQDTVQPSDVANWDWPSRASIDETGTLLLIGAPFDDDGGSASGMAFIYDLTDGIASNEQKLVFSKTHANQWLGGFVLVSGDGTTLFVAGRGTTGPSSEADVGAIFVFIKSGGTWIEQDMLQAGTVVADSRMGISIACDYTGGKLIAGAFLDGANDEGAAHYWSRSGSTWTEDLKVTAATPITNGHFGLNVEMSDDGLVSYVGGLEAGGAWQGYVEVRRYVTGAWQAAASQVLVASDAATNDYFGVSNGYSVYPDMWSGLGISASNTGSTIAIGARGWEGITGTNRGAVYIFDDAAGTYSETEIIEGTLNTTDDSWFGWGVHLTSDASKLLIGAQSDTTQSLTLAGAAFLYHRNDSVYSLFSGLEAPTPEASVYFGYDVQLSGNGGWAIVTDTADASPHFGKARTYIFQLAEQAIPDPYSIWITTSDTVSPEEWRVISVTEEDKNIYAISALEYNSSKYAAIEEGLELEVKQVSLIDPTYQAPVSGLTMEESLYLITPTIAAARIIVSWKAPEGAVKYTITYYRDEENTITVGTRNPEVEILNTIPGTYYVDVTAHSSIGVISAVTSTSSTILGLIAAPADIANFNINIIGPTTYLSWDKVVDLDLSYYQIRFAPVLTGASWAASGVLIDKISKDTTSISVPSVIGTYSIKAVDTSEVSSENAAFIVTNISSVEGLNIVETITEDPTFLGDKGSEYTYDLSANSTTTESVTYSKDGLRMYILDGSTRDLMQFDLSAAFQAPSASLPTVSSTLSLNSEDTGMIGVSFRDNGLVMFALGDIGNKVYQYTLTTAWDISTASYDGSGEDYTISEESSLLGFTFSSLGHKMYVCGLTNNKIQSYFLSTSWDVSTASWDGAAQDIDLSGKTTQPRDIRFNLEGTKMLVLSSSSPTRVLSYTLSTGWLLSSATYDGDSNAYLTGLTTPASFEFNYSSPVYYGSSFDLDASTQESVPNTMALNDDGTKLYILGNNSDTVYQYTLSIAWDTSTATYAGATYDFSISSQDGEPRSLVFSNDGTKFFILGFTNKKIYSYSLSSAWDMSSASYDTSTYDVSIGTEDSSPSILAFAVSGVNTGKKMYMLGNTNDTVYQYTLGTAWDTSTASYDGAGSDFDVSTQISFPTALTFNTNGLEMFITGTTDKSINKYMLTSAWDTNTASHTGDKYNFSLSTQDTTPRTLLYKPDGSRLYVLGLTNKKVYQYYLGEPWGVLSGGSEITLIDSQGDDTAYMAALTTDFDVSTAITMEATIVESNQLKLRDPSAVATGTYTFDNSLDLGGVFTSRITPSLTIFSENVDNIMSSWVTLASVDNLAGSGSDQYSISMELRTTDDDPAGSPTWSAWKQFIIGDYSARAFEFRSILTSLASNITPVIDELSVVVDMEDRVYGEDDISSAGVSGLFVAVSSDGTGNSRVMTSSNGTSWTTRTSAADQQWRSIAWAPEIGIFCAVAITGTQVMTSSDGISWATQSCPGLSWRDITWSPELKLFVAVSYNGTGDGVMTSSDGVTWESRTPAADNGWYGVVWSPELRLFAAVATTGTDRVMTSPEGITWTSRNIATVKTWIEITWSPKLSMFCAVAFDGVVTSTDGITWTNRSASIANGWRSVAWSPQLGLFAVVSNSGTGTRVMTSPDGINWTTRTSAEDNPWEKVTWSSDLGLFVAVASSGTNRVMTSSNGISWSTASASTANSWTAITWRPSGLNVKYLPVFKETPSLAISAQGLTTGDYYEITDKTSRGFNIVFKDSTDTVSDKTFDYVAKGYGYSN